jgi:hypothetical protein
MNALWPLVHGVEFYLWFVTDFVPEKCVTDSSYLLTLEMLVFFLPRIEPQRFMHKSKCWWRTYAHWKTTSIQVNFKFTFNFCGYSSSIQTLYIVSIKISHYYMHRDVVTQSTVLICYLAVLISRIVFIFINFQKFCESIRNQALL